MTRELSDRNYAKRLTLLNRLFAACARLVIKGRTDAAFIHRLGLAVVRRKYPCA